MIDEIEALEMASQFHGTGPVYICAQHVLEMKQGLQMFCTCRAAEQSEGIISFSSRTFASWAVQVRVIRVFRGWKPSVQPAAGPFRVARDKLVNSFRMAEHHRQTGAGPVTIQLCLPLPMWQSSRESESCPSRGS
jgi:hypothetical protein